MGQGLASHHCHTRKHWNERAALRLVLLPRDWPSKGFVQLPPDSWMGLTVNTGLMRKILRAPLLDRESPGPLLPTGEHHSWWPERTAGTMPCICIFRNGVIF